MNSFDQDLNFGTIIKESAPRQIAARIKALILEGKLGAFDKLPTEEELATRFSVSRPTIREMLKWLAAENLVESRRGPTGGTFVKMPTVADVRARIADVLMIAASLDLFTFEDVVESRYALGEICCTAAAHNHLPEDVEAMRLEIAHQRRSDLTDVEFCASDVRFHAALARATHNAIITALAAGAIEGLEPITNLMLYRFRARTVVTDQHEVLTAYLVARDAAGMIETLQQQKSYLIEKHGEAKTWRTKRRGGQT